MAHPALPPPDLEASLEALHEASFGWARNCCGGHPDDAADVLQTAYVKVLSGGAVFAGRSSFRTWLFGVIRLTALELRRRGARELSLEGLAEPPAPAPSTEAVLIEAEEHAALRAALAMLPDRQREVLHLVFQQEMSIADASGVMGVSVGSARVHYDRAKKRMRTLLADGRAHGTTSGRPPSIDRRNEDEGRDRR
jgi:RNA polymerase sigma-70 factor (ECF subfamily)